MKSLGYMIYHKPHYIFKSNDYEIINSNIALFIWNDTIIKRSFMGIHRDLRMRKVHVATISSD